MSRVLLDKTLERNQIQRYLNYIKDYELIKKKNHPLFKTFSKFCRANGIHRQTFHVYYKRYRQLGSKESLLPKKRGPKTGLKSQFSDEVREKIVEFRQKGFDRYGIRQLLERSYAGKEEKIPSTSSIRRMYIKAGLRQMSKPMKEMKRQLIKEKAGELGHIDCHYLSKDVIKGKKEQLYLVGVIDDYSRVSWIKVIKRLKSLDVMFATFDMLLLLEERFSLRFEEMLTDNGKEFSSPNKKEEHAFERCLSYLNIKHRYTRPYRPQTNGKIERLWKTLKEEMLEGEQFENIEELEEAILEFNMYYNYYRPHRGIEGKVPAEMLGIEIERKA